MRSRRSAACLATLFAGLSGAACAPAVAGQASASPSKAEGAALRTPQAPHLFVVDERVVARKSLSAFREANVERVKVDRMIISWADGTSTSEVPSSDVLNIPKPGTKKDVKSGDFVVAYRAGQGARWEGAEVKEVHSDYCDVRYASNGLSAHLPFDSILAIPNAMAIDLKDEITRVDFLLDAKRHRPVNPPNYKPRIGDQVLAAYAPGDWYSGTVKAITSETATIVWKEEMEPTLISLEEVVLASDGRALPKPQLGAFVLVREGSTRWSYARVAALVEAGVEVTMADGQKRTVGARNVVALD